MPKKSMGDKIGEIIHSPRFLQLFFVGLVSGLMVAFPNNPYVLAFSTMIGVWFGGSVIIGTVDRVSEKKIEATKIEAENAVVVAEKAIEAETVKSDAIVEVAKIENE